MAIFYVIPQSHCVILERFGKFSRVQQAGINFHLPIVEHIRRVDYWGDVANKDGWLIELTEQQTDTPSRVCHTKDNVPVKANASVYWRIVNSQHAVYEVDNLPRVIGDVALNALRSNIGAMELDMVLSERQTLNENIAEQLAKMEEQWGIRYTRVEIQELTTSGDVSTAMLQQMEAERRRRARIAEAEGQAVYELRVAEAEKKAAILRAEGHAQAMKLLAEAEQEYLRVLSQTITPIAATQLLLAQKVISGFETISQNPAHKVFMPNSFAGLFSFPERPAGMETSLPLDDALAGNRQPEA